MTQNIEVNFDGLVGPTHYYGGLSAGNLASTKSKYHQSNPKQAALQGLEKMKLVMDLGVKQAIIPPQPRPLYNVLKRLGYPQISKETLDHLLTTNPDLLAACFSASSMWTANLGTMTPSSDSHNGQYHITPANLMSNFHRSLEIIYSKTLLKQIFPMATHHPPNLTSIPDEGAANVMRFCDTEYNHGIHVFVYGRSIFEKKNQSKLYPCRQSKEALDIIASSHQLKPEEMLFFKQNPDVIDQGVFHNDVIAMNHQNIFIYHEKAYKNLEENIQQLKTMYLDKCGSELHCVQVHESDILVGEAVSTYLFNSQILTLPDQRVVLLAPKECQGHIQARSVIEKRILTKTPISEVHYVDVSQSMHNGGGPACLRWRVVLSEEEIKQINPQIFLTDTLYQILREWIEKYYSEDLTLEKLIEPEFINQNQHSLHELYDLLHMSFWE